MYIGYKISLFKIISTWYILLGFYPHPLNEQLDNEDSDPPQLRSSIQKFTMLQLAPYVKAGVKVSPVIYLQATVASELSKPSSPINKRRTT